MCHFLSWGHGTDRQTDGQIAALLDAPLYRRLGNIISIWFVIHCTECKCLLHTSKEALIIADTVAWLSCGCC